jgi:hypothetical protein
MNGMLGIKTNIINVKMGVSDASKNDDLDVNIYVSLPEGKSKS